jgi:hypothetical protein
MNAGGLLGGLTGGVGGYIVANRLWPSSEMPQPTQYPGFTPYNPAYDPSKMSTLPGMQQYLNQIQTDPRGIEALRSEALRPGASRWGNLAREQNAQSMAAQRGQAAQQAATARAEQMNQLASRGGLTSGARERAAIQGGKNALNMQQNITHQGNQNNLQIGTNEEQQRLTNLQALPTAENAALQPTIQKMNAWQNAFNTDVGRQIQETQAQNAYNQWVQSEKNKQIATNNQANQELWTSQHTGGLFGSGGFLGLGI